jgi:hypothetical protein
VAAAAATAPPSSPPWFRWNQFQALHRLVQLVGAVALGGVQPQLPGAVAQVEVESTGLEVASCVAAHDAQLFQQPCSGRHTDAPAPRRWCLPTVVCQVVRARRRDHWAGGRRGSTLLIAPISTIVSTATSPAWLRAVRCRRCSDRLHRWGAAGAQEARERAAPPRGARSPAWHGVAQPSGPWGPGRSTGGAQKVPATCELRLQFAAQSPRPPRRVTRRCGGWRS